MRRLTGLLLALTTGGGAVAAAQSPRVGLTIRLVDAQGPRAGRQPVVGVVDLLRDRRWSEALEQAFPIRLVYRLEIWRSREGWIDEFQRATEWSTVIQREPLQETYRVTDILQAGASETRFSTTAELEAFMATERQVDVVPRGSGAFYYTVRVRITALSDEDMDELERFLAGQPSNPGGERSPIARAFRRLFLTMAGLPREELEVRSEKFTATGPPEDQS